MPLYTHKYTCVMVVCIHTEKICSIYQMQTVVKDDLYTLSYAQNIWLRAYYNFCENKKQKYLTETKQMSHRMSFLALASDPSLFPIPPVHVSESITTKPHQY